MNGEKNGKRRHRRRNILEEVLMQNPRERYLCIVPEQEARRLAENE